MHTLLFPETLSEHGYSERRPDNKLQCDSDTEQEESWLTSFTQEMKLGDTDDTSEHLVWHSTWGFYPTPNLWMHVILAEFLLESQHFFLHDAIYTCHLFCFFVNCVSINPLNGHFETANWKHVQKGIYARTRWFFRWSDEAVLKKIRMQPFGKVSFS